MAVNAERLPSPEKKMNWAGNGEVEWSLSSRWEEREISERERESKKSNCNERGIKQKYVFSTLWGL